MWQAAVRELWGQRDSGKCPLLKKSLELDEHHKDRQFKARQNWLGQLTMQTVNICRESSNEDTSGGAALSA